MMNEDSRPPESPRPSTDPDLETDRSPNAPVHSRAWRFALWAIFLTGFALGIAFQGPIWRGLVALVPPPERNREVLYWVSPHDPSRHFDHPGRTRWGWNGSRFMRARKSTAIPTINPVIQESEYTTAPVERGPLVRTLRTVSTVEFAEPLIGEITLKVDAWLEKLGIDYEGQAGAEGRPSFRRLFSRPARHHGRPPDRRSVRAGRTGHQEGDHSRSGRECPAPASLLGRQRVPDRSHRENRRRCRRRCPSPRRSRGS